MGRKLFRRGGMPQVPAVLRGIAVPEPFSLDAFLAAVADARGRPVEVLSLRSDETRGSGGGVWVERDGVDVVLVEESTSPVHREHIVLRGVAHMLCGHRTDSVDLAAVVADWPPRAARAALSRHRYTPEQEREADEIAAALMTRIRRPAEPTRPDDVLERLNRVLEPNRR